MPAVSFIFKVKLPRFIYSVIESLVVPGISVTIALFSFNKTFNSEDLPTLGFPIIVVSIPPFTNFPLLAVDKSFVISSFALSI